MSRKRERKKERKREREKMPFIVATYVSACSQGQRTHSARTNYKAKPAKYWNILSNLFGLVTQYLCRITLCFVRCCTIWFPKLKECSAIFMFMFIYTGFPLMFWFGLISFIFMRLVHHLFCHLAAIFFLTKPNHEQKFCVWNSVICVQFIMFGS